MRERRARSARAMKRRLARRGGGCCRCCRGRGGREVTRLPPPSPWPSFFGAAEAAATTSDKEGAGDATATAAGARCCPPSAEARTREPFCFYGVSMREEKKEAKQRVSQSTSSERRRMRNIAKKTARATKSGLTLAGDTIEGHELIDLKVYFQAQRTEKRSRSWRRQGRDAIEVRR